MAKRPKFSRWRRLPRVYRSGEFKLPDPNPEPQRLTLYLKDALLEQAERQAERAGVETVQQYCADLLSRAIQAEQIRGQVAEIEARSGPLEGLQEIANDPAYLAEWSAQATPREPAERIALEINLAPQTEHEPPGLELSTPDRNSDSDAPAPSPEAPEPISASGRVVLHHAGQGEEDDRLAFLPSLRRGEMVSVNEIAELARALQTLEVETREAKVLDRRVAFALHRLAYEGQILHTDAWPGVFDAWTVDTLHAVQEAVERILSGQDIRYYPTNP
ncbi:hypothetical protein SAMN05444166_7680 [Singulisphaera sp. GP187]|uniref:hypothetical protein n=1 Tax=Singulisphaera sp. GP187 TaxID=1882752 RepID=UPI0009294B37|nr:hypothetical protein [Singulisphaera sp. GP187]SIO65389.1 hypothetical protein SAMN05444166_7680 [Singulisphaera sp. GP187]